MDNDKIKLNYYQVMAFAFRINDLEKENANFDKEKVTAFFDIVMNKIIEVNIEDSFLPNFVLKRIKLYTISTALYQYLIQITGIDINDKEVMEKYYGLVNLYNEHALQLQLIKSSSNDSFVKRRVKN